MSKFGGMGGGGTAYGVMNGIGGKMSGEPGTSGTAVLLLLF